MDVLLKFMKLGVNLMLHLSPKLWISLGNRSALKSLPIGTCWHACAFGENIGNLPNCAQDRYVHGTAQWKILSIRVIGHLLGEQITISMSSDEEINLGGKVSITKCWWRSGIPAIQDSEVKTMKELMKDLCIRMLSACLLRIAPFEMGRANMMSILLKGAIEISSYQ